MTTTTNCYRSCSDAIAEYAKRHPERYTDNDRYFVDTLFRTTDMIILAVAKAHFLDVNTLGERLAEEDSSLDKEVFEDADAITRKIRQLVDLDIEPTKAAKAITEDYLRLSAVIN